MLSRREMLIASAASFITGGCKTSIENQASILTEPGLNQIAKTRGLRFGTAISSAALEDPDYLNVIQHDCGSLVAENEHKIYVVQGRNGPMQWERPDAIVDFATQNQMAMRGHVLLWNRDDFLPGWMTKSQFDQQDMRAFLSQYFEDMALRYRNKILSWDVVNETIDPQTGLPRETLFTKTFGADVVDWAFRETRRLLPDIQLVYNDYMIWEPGNEKHRTGVLKLLEGFRARNVPIDAFGIQSHLGTGNGDIMDEFPDPQRREWRDFVDEIVAMDYNIILSEFDVNDTRLTANFQKRDEQIAAYAGAYLDMMFDYESVSEILAWGMADHYSWLQTWWPRQDGIRKRPTLYDEAMKPKPLYHAVAKSLRNAPRRKITYPILA